MSKRENVKQVFRHKQWVNPNITYPMIWSEYVGQFLKDYDNLDATSIHAQWAFLKKYFIFGDDKAKDTQLKALIANPHAGDGLNIINKWKQACLHRAETSPLDAESTKATELFVLWCQGPGQTGDKLPQIMHSTTILGVTLAELWKEREEAAIRPSKVRKVKGGKRLIRRGKSRGVKSRGVKSRSVKSRSVKSRRQRRSSNRNRLTRSRR